MLSQEAARRAIERPNQIVEILGARSSVAEPVRRFREHDLQQFAGRQVFAEAEVKTLSLETGSGSRSALRAICSCHRQRK